jgi:cell division protein FtsW
LLPSAGWRRNETSCVNQVNPGRRAGPPQARPDPLGGSIAVLGERGAALSSAIERIKALPWLAQWRAADSALPIREGPLRGAGPPASIAGFDRALVWPILALLALGLVMVYSASVALPDNPKFARYAPTHFLTRHAMSLAIGIVAALVALRIPIKLWERAAPWLLVASLLLLALVLLPVFKPINGARRWLPLGLMSFQPSELAKLAIAMYAASYMVRKMEVKENFFRAVWPMTVALGVIGLLLLAEPDMGAFVVIAAIAVGILFLGGINGRMFLLVCAVLALAFVVMIVFSPWRADRIHAWLNPWDDQWARTKAYQLTHSLIAFGRGEVFGQGLGASVEKLHYLPEAHTDFLLAVIGEELGFVGVLAVIVAFFWLTRRIFVIGRQAIALDRVFAGLMAQGIGVWIGGQAFISMGVNLGALPTKGLTLPLLSYGGSAMLMNLVALAIVVRVDLENRQLMRGGRA